MTRISTVAPPVELAIAPGGATRRLTRAGPSLNGWIYRATDESACYRRVAAERFGIERRAAFKTVGQIASAGYAPAETALEPDEDPGYALVRYHVPGLTSTLAEALVDPLPIVRAKATLAAWRAAAVWWSQDRGPVLPLPAEIALAGDTEAILLTGPIDRVEVGPFLADPECASFLPPELARGATSSSREDVLRFVLGGALLRCAFTIVEPPDPEAALEAAAAGRLHEPQACREALPFWLLRLPTTKVVVDLARRCVAFDPTTRRGVDVDELCGAIDEWIALMNPLAAASRLSQFGRNKEALGLLHDTLLTQESYEMLQLAASIAGTGLRRPLEAIDLLERAIALDPERVEAVEGQFTTIATVRHRPEMRALFARDSLAAQIDERLQRDFARLDRTAQVEQAAEMAEYLLWRGRYETAASAIYPFLFDDGEFAWWRFDLNIAYVRALTGKGSLDDALNQLRLVRKHLEEAHLDARLSIDDYQLHLAAVEVCKDQLAARRAAGGAL